MSVFFCHGCNQYVDSDVEDCEIVDNVELCSSCVDECMINKFNLGKQPSVCYFHLGI